MGKQWKAWQTLFIYFFGPKSLQIVTATMKLKDACSLEEKLWQTWALSTEWSRWVMSDSWHPMDCSTPGSSISGIFQRILEWVFIFFSMTNLESILKSGDITLLTKVCLVKVMFFSVVMYGSESCTIKKTESQRIDAFELWCWRRLLRACWTARRSNQSILKEISPEYSLEGLMLKLKLQCFGHLIQRTDSLEKTLMLGKMEGRRRRGWEDEMVGWHHGLDRHEFEKALGAGDGQGSLVCCSH